MVLIALKGLKKITLSIIYLNKMVRKTSSAPVAVSEPVVAPAPVIDVPPTPAAPKKSKKTEKATSAPAPVVDIPHNAPVVPTPTPVETLPENEVVEVADVAKLDSDVVGRCVEFASKLQTATIQLTSLRTEFKQLEKQLLKEIKTLQKTKGRKNKVLSANRKPSGFVKPSKITGELAEFLGLPLDIEIARTEVSKEINKYIKAHNLKDPANGRNINPDAKLTALLKLSNEDKLNYFNLQKYMKHHFVK